MKPTKTNLLEREPLELSTGSRKRIQRKAREIILREQGKRQQVKLTRLADNYLSLGYGDEAVFGAIEAGMTEGGIQNGAAA